MDHCEQPSLCTVHRLFSAVQYLSAVLLVTPSSTPPIMFQILNTTYHSGVSHIVKAAVSDQFFLHRAAATVDTGLAAPINIMVKGGKGSS